METLTNEQKTALEAIDNAVKSNKPALFFIEGPAGSGKTYLLQYLCQQYCTLPLSYASLAARSFVNGRTSHSLLEDGLEGVESLNKIQIIVCDTANMMSNDHFQMLDETLKRLTGNEEKFGGKTVVFAGDFNQIESIGYADWPMGKVNKYCLSKNLRARGDPEFAALLQQIDRNVLDCEELKEMHEELFTTKESKILGLYSQNPDKDVAVLFATKNLCEKFNEEMIKRLGEEKAVTMMKNVDNHEMHLKIGTVCIFIGNKPTENIFLNGTRFVIKEFDGKVVLGKLLNGPNKGKSVEIHPNDFGSYPFEVSFGMTINKICGWEFEKIGLCLDTRQLWDNAMLYTALSRVRSSKDVTIYDWASK